MSNSKAEEKPLHGIGHESPEHTSHDWNSLHRNDLSARDALRPGRDAEDKSGKPIDVHDGGRLDRQPTNNDEELPSNNYEPEHPSIDRSCGRNNDGSMDPKPIDQRKWPRTPLEAEHNLRPQMPYFHNYKWRNQRTKSPRTAAQQRM
ncbi:MAG: hypothetical protein ABF380_03645 [Akkermansiaceae bacterium]